MYKFPKGDLNQEEDPKTPNDDFSIPNFSTRKLVRHKPESFTLGTLFKLLFMLYVDGGEFVIESRWDI